MQAYCDGLETLKLAGCAVSDASLKLVAENCPSLQMVEVSDTGAVTAASLDLLPKTCSVKRLAADR